MSIASEIQRLQSAKVALKTAIRAKGVAVQDTDKLDSYASKVELINPVNNKNVTFSVDFTNKTIKIGDDVILNSASNQATVQIPSGFTGFNSILLQNNSSSFNLYCDEIDVKITNSIAGISDITSLNVNLNSVREGTLYTWTFNDITGFSGDEVIMTSISTPTTITVAGGDVLSFTISAFINTTQAEGVDVQGSLFGEGINYHEARSDWNTLNTSCELNISSDAVSSGDLIHLTLTNI